MPKFIPKIPDSLYHTMCRVHGNHVKAWLTQVPNILSDLFVKYDLQFVREFDNLSYNWVMVVKGQQSNFVLKLSPPNPELQSEIAALKAFSQGMVKLVESDSELGFVLLEHLVPGITLREFAYDALETEIAADIIKKLSSVSKSDFHFKCLSDWLNGFEIYMNKSIQTIELDCALCLQAQKLSQWLLDSTKEKILLHGDLHHENILKTDSGWKAIDPKGIVGDKVYGVGAFLINPYPDIVYHENLKRITLTRLNIFSEHLGYEKERMIQWAFVQAMLSAIWFCDEQSSAGALQMQTMARFFESLIL